jgi:acyl carrier protein
MEDKEILSRIERILKFNPTTRVPWVSEDMKLTPEMNFRKDLGMDSLDTYEFAYALEENLGITIPDEKCNEFETIKEYLDYARTQVN